MGNLQAALLGTTSAPATAAQETVADALFLSQPGADTQATCRPSVLISSQPDQQLNVSSVHLRTSGSGLTFLRLVILQNRRSEFF